MSGSAVRVSGLFSGSGAGERHLPKMRFPVAKPCLGSGTSSLPGPIQDYEVF